MIFWIADLVYWARRVKVLLYTQEVWLDWWSAPRMCRGFAHWRKGPQFASHAMQLCPVCHFPTLCFPVSSTVLSGKGVNLFDAFNTPHCIYWHFLSHCSVLKLCNVATIQPEYRVCLFCAVVLLTQRHTRQ